MKPLDPRLLRWAHAARAYVALSAALGLLHALLLVAQAMLLARVIAAVAMDQQQWQQVSHYVWWLLGVVAARALLSGLNERYAQRSATRVIAQLRQAVTARAANLPGAAGHDVATLVTRGIDALDGYLTKYLPQLLLAATVTPAVLAVVLWHDTLSAVTIAVTLPLIPLFMMLVGWASADAAARRLRSMQTLGSQVLDLVAGLPTLRALGRDRGQAQRVRQIGDAYRVATMKTLRSAFLSALILESLTTLSVALVAVGIGLRLVHGSLDLETGLAVLIMAPEVYLPLRMVGVHYHASVDGLAAAAAAFEILEHPVPARGSTPAPDLRHTTIEIRDVSVAHHGRTAATPAGCSFTIAPGKVIAITGASGVGKSTMLDLLLLLRYPTHGQIVLAEADDDQRSDPKPPTDLTALDPDSWHAQLTWVSQRPLLVPGTVLDNLVVSGSQLVSRSRAATTDGETPTKIHAHHTNTAFPHTTPGAEPHDSITYAEAAVLTTPATAQLDPEPGAGQVFGTDPVHDSVLQRVAQQTGFDAVVADLPHGWHTRIGYGGHGLSAGQRQRLALTRALLHPHQLVILDEPTAHLDAATESVVHQAISRLRAQGRTVVIAAHRTGLSALADEVVTITSAEVPASENLSDSPTVSSSADAESHPHLPSATDPPATAASATASPPNTAGMPPNGSRCLAEEGER